MSDLYERLERLRQAGRLNRRPTTVGPQPEEALPAPRPPRPAAPLTPISDLSELPGMEVVQGSAGSFLLRTVRHELGHNQGRVRVGDLLALPGEYGAIAANDPDLAGLDFGRMVFIDTETSGLAGGTGTIVFLTGVGRFEDDGYVVRQYFARHPAEEPAYLPHLAALLNDATGLVSFNGKAFDLPLLRTRYLMAGLRPPNLALPHLDLLHPARRLWRQRLGACNFGRLEAEVLGHERGGQDVPSWLIPDLWFRFAAGENNTDDMAHVLYHNLHDILSMAPLASIICGTFGGAIDPHPGDLLALAYSHAARGRHTEAEAAYRRALADPLRPEQRRAALAGLAASLKQQERRDEAAIWWQTLADLQPPEIEPYIELAKYHEWETKDLNAALAWTHKARAVAERWRPGYQRTQALAEIEHRRQRLARKMEG
jgi:hypothetical protein